MRVRAPLCWWTLRRLTQHLSTIADWGTCIPTSSGRGAHEDLRRRERSAGLPVVLRWRAVLHYRGDVRCPRGSLSLRGDVALKSDGTDTVTINGAISVVSTLIVSGATTLNGATSNPGTFGFRQRGNRLRDDHWFDSFTDALIVTGVAYVQGAVTLGNEATDVTTIAGRHDFHRWRRNLFWRGHSG